MIRQGNHSFGWFSDLENIVFVFSHHRMPAHLIPAAWGTETHGFKVALDNISISVDETYRNGSRTLH